MLPKDSKLHFFEPFDFVREVEVFEIQKATWKTINYISEPERLQIISPGSMQISGSQILIFGGLIPREQSSNPEKTYDVSEQKTDLTITGQSIILDVTVGSIKYGPELTTPAYFVSGGYMMPTQAHIYCLGMTLQQHVQIGAFSNLAAAPDESKKQAFEIGASHHKKLIQCYNVNEQKWSESNESIFAAGGHRKDSDINDDWFNI